MTRDEFLAGLRRMAASDDAEEGRCPGARRDIEADHRRADAMLLELLGDAEIAEAFDSVRKWYS